MASLSTSTKPQSIRVARTEYSLYDFFMGDNLTKMKKRFDDVLTSAQEEWPQHNLTESNIRLDEEVEYGYYGESDRGILVITIDRLETDEEVKERLSKVRKSKRVAKVKRDAKKISDAAALQSAELAEYERLRKVFGDA